MLPIELVMQAPPNPKCTKCGGETELYDVALDLNSKRHVYYYKCRLQVTCGAMTDLDESGEPWVPYEGPMPERYMPCTGAFVGIQNHE